MINITNRSRTIVKLTLLMFIPWIAIVGLAPVYNRYNPTLGGWPFPYWYLILWVFIQPVLTFVVYTFVDKEGKK